MNFNLIIKAIVFAAEKHKFQRRKGFSRIPYINHPLKVAQILSDCGEEDEKLIIASILHDVIEDTDASLDDIIHNFGKEICDIILEVTDDKKIPSSLRKKLQIKSAPGLSENAKKLKIADKICNIRDIVNYPLFWSTRRKRNYLEWAQKVVAGCSGVNSRLESIFSITLEEGFKALGS
jgi:GTP diphosphokinase / guanosine-3',5'-bis(diphosphate) 3'-diphosphatase